MELYHKYILEKNEVRIRRFLFDKSSLTIVTL